ncbi:MAG: cytidylate kinase [Patescibacteria group bacterium]
MDISSTTILKSKIEQTVNMKDSNLYNPIIITFDGTSASGKGTLVKGLQKKLNNSRYKTLDAGLMYRALTHHYQQHTNAEKLQQEHEGDLFDFLNDTISIQYNGKNIRVNDEIIDEKDLRGPDIDPFVGKYASLDAVKTYIVDQQKKAVQEHPENGWILDGRCMGSAVAPQAQAKFYTDAPLQVRATRRHNDYIRSGKRDFSTKQIELDLERRDELDKNTIIAPLIRPNDAIDINTYENSPETGLHHVLEHVYHKIAEAGKLQDS